MKRFLVVACIVIFAGWAILHLAGARSDVGVLSGTVPASDGALLLGIGFALASFGTVIVVPIVALALLFDHTCGRLVRWRRTRAR